MKTKYTPELGNKICSGLAGGKSLVTVCRELKIDYSTVFDWMRDPRKKEFADNYMRAREAQIDYIAEDILGIADDASIPPDDRRIRIDTRKWYAGKMQPKKYGDKQAVDVNARVTLEQLVVSSMKKQADE